MLLLVVTVAAATEKTEINPPTKWPTRARLLPSVGLGEGEPTTRIAINPINHWCRNAGLTSSLATSQIPTRA